MEVKELGHVVLYVRDIERSAAFYRDVLGWQAIESPEELRLPIAAFSSGRTHHELLLIEVGEDAAALPEGKRVGMYHFGLKIGDTDDELRDALDELRRHNVAFVGSADHGVTHSLYIEDPDGNEIELYIDVQPEVWRDNPRAFLAPTRSLRL
jgi:catechol-2,3-dioxygenase